MSKNAAPSRFYPFTKAPAGFDFLLDESYKRGSLTAEDISLIIRILIGCAKLAPLSNAASVKRAKIKKTKPSMKALTSLSLFSRMTDDENLKKKFSPKDIREGLPEKIRQIKSSNLNDIFYRDVERKLITGATPETRKGGRPKHNDPNGTNSSFYRRSGGRPSFYQQSEYLESLKKVLAKPIARGLIYAFLMESNIIFWTNYIGLLELLYSLRSMDLEDLKTFRQACGYIVEESELKSQHSSIKNMDDDEIEETAYSYTMKLINEMKYYDMEPFVNSCIIGGFYFYDRK